MVGLESAAVSRSKILLSDFIGESNMYDFLHISIRKSTYPPHIACRIVAVRRTCIWNERKWFAKKRKDRDDNEQKRRPKMQKRNNWARECKENPALSDMPIPQSGCSKARASCSWDLFHSVNIVINENDRMIPRIKPRGWNFKEESFGSDCRHV